MLHLSKQMLCFATPDSWWKRRRWTSAQPLPGLTALLAPQQTDVVICNSRFVADAWAVHFDTLPPGLTALSALTALHLNNCFEQPPAESFGGLSQLQRLALEVGFENSL